MFVNHRLRCSKSSPAVVLQRNEVFDVKPVTEFEYSTN